MSDAREEILRRIGVALRDVPGGENRSDVPVAREYRREDDAPSAELVARLTARLHDYHATVRRVAVGDLGTAVGNLGGAVGNVGGAVGDACAELGLRRLIVPPELPVQWRPEGVELVEDHGLSAHDLDGFDGAITGCAAAIAETGTLILDGQGVSGRRAITLVPDHHICVVTTDQVVGLVPEALARVAPSVSERGLPITLISGPSATSDIELTRVEGVHGPRHLLVLIA
jgi:L-lactate dehydrogenase complex protein LldG